MSPVPDIRIRSLNSHPVNTDGDCVLYWMTAFRRIQWNFSLQHAVNLAAEQQKPLVILEALRCGYEWASDRLHTFVIQGMGDNHRTCADYPVTYYPYLESEKGAGSGLLQALARHASAIVTDDFPSFFLPKMISAAAKKVDVKMDAVDSNGLYPMRATDRVFTRAFSFRNFLQKELPNHLGHMPLKNSLSRAKLPKPMSLPKAITDRWPVVSDELLSAEEPDVSRFPIDHSVQPVSMRGGSEAAVQKLKKFMKDGFSRYGDDRNHPDHDASSGLSPWLHFGHIAAHEVFDVIAKEEEWEPSQVADQSDTKGSREGWWNMSPAAESFLDELITWREIGFNACCHTDDFDQYESLPDWARESLEKHESDDREHTYSLDEFAAAKTHDEIWNAAQRELVAEGRMHNYLRMLWGKKILEWTPSPREAIDVMIELNNRFAVDGRNPNSYSGIFWVLGRYDRAWGPERPIYGKIRYMTSESTRKKLKMKEYLKKYGADQQQNLFD